MIQKSRVIHFHREKYDKYDRYEKRVYNTVKQGKHYKNLLCFYVTVLFITAFLAVRTQNRIELHIMANRILAEGIDYDAFRSMKLPVKDIDKIKKKLDKVMAGKTDPVLKSEKTNKLMNDFTISALAGQYHNGSRINLSKSSLKLLSKDLSQNKSVLELSRYYRAVLNDIKSFPIDKKLGKEVKVTFLDSWNSFRSYGGKRRHEGTDIMPEENIRGFYPVISMTDGVIEKMGWLNQGGYRVGVRGPAGAYFYYAHLDSYAPDLKVGDIVKAGSFLGYMGDSGYGPEGTKGKFLVHLHLGIYVDTAFGELSVNPYQILRYLKK